MQPHLKDQSYYSDRYDLFTIKECLRHIESWQKASKAAMQSKELKQMTKKERRDALARTLNLNLYMIKGERYRIKSEAVQRWMDKDRQRDDFYNAVSQPEHIVCPECRKEMNVILKDLYERTEKPLRVLFMFECLSCEKRNAYFDNGEPFKIMPVQCPKCRRNLKTMVSEEKDYLIWRWNCSCGYLDEERENAKQVEMDRKNREREERELLVKHRKEFCFSEEEGREYLDSLFRIEQLAKIVKTAEQKQTDPDYKKAAKITKWNLPVMEKMLSGSLEQEGFQKLVLDKPEIGKFVIVSFTVQDASSRNERESEWQLRKLIKHTLSGSNWRLMSDGVSYRLGCLSGRLKGYEQEEDLVGLIRAEKPPIL